jgi:hypothetical protein
MLLDLSLGGRFQLITWYMVQEGRKDSLHNFCPENRVDCLQTFYPKCVVMSSGVMFRPTGEDVRNVKRGQRRRKGCMRS